MNDPRNALDDVVVATGLDEAGRSLLPPLSPEQLGRLVAEEEPDPEMLHLIQDWSEGKAVQDPFRAPSVDIEDPTDLSEAGWGVIFAEDTPASVRRALRPLLELRSEQAGERYFELSSEEAESQQLFMSRVGFKAGTRPAGTNLPYYILLVGDPEKISFRFQRELDVQFAVGRLHFDLDDPNDPEGSSAAYRAYAEGVKAAEEGRCRRRRELTFFSVENAGDEATRRVAGGLVGELAKVLSAGRPVWETEIIGNKDATRAGLGELLRSTKNRPSILFSASHGVRILNGAEMQFASQGAIVCRDWGGPGCRLERSHYFAADDVPGDADLSDLIVFQFGCYSAGTPRFDQFGLLSGVNGEIAPRSFVARLPQTLLKRGALAVIGHVDRAWTSSFSWNGEGGHVQVYNDILKQLIDGMPVGWAMEAMGAYFGAQAASLHEMRNERSFFRPADYVIYGDVWRETADAGNFIVLGDPAVRLNLD